MSYYILESSKKTLAIGDDTFDGIDTTGYSPLWLYVVNTEEKPTDWPESPTGRNSGRRRAPPKVEKEWWVVVKPGAKARSTKDGRRSTGEPLDTPPQGYPVFNWPTADLADDLKKILADGKIGTTEKESLINARIGQGAFRDGVLRRWDQRCAVTGSSTLKAIRASHIKPWSKSSNQERWDPHNGLPLVANLDALFDAGLISFDPSGRLIISSQLDARERMIYGLRGKSLAKTPAPKTAKYLAYHRNRVFRK